MGLTPILQTFASACKRYGPGRLPRADRRDVGAGYASASAALGITVTFALGTFGLFRLGVWTDIIHPLWGWSALVALPFVVPAAFLVGTGIWRLLPDRVPFFGAVAGSITAALTYVVSLAFVFLVLLAVSVVSGTGPGTGTVEELLYGTAALTAIIGFFAALLSAWLTIPVGCVNGAIYERARTVRADSAR
ncbi:hypothetical protein AB7C87_01025 [Natrarchaeobius sp. A-rgal3]|uniref:hypothetical protein n=1 Tax=Natrarchaeobius versutus TaxID=1679078 RepID=UPI00350EC50C